MNIKLKKAREEQNLTQLEVAKKSEITERSYQYIEAGKRSPNVCTAIMIAKALNSTVEKLFAVADD